MNKTAAGRCLGLIGGLGVGAAVHYYQELVKAHAARGVVPHLVMVHADVARVLKHVGRGETGELADYLARLIGQMAAAGADIAAVPAIAPHICAPRLAEISRLPLVNLVEEAAREVRARGYRRVALFGTRFAVESRLFGRLEDVEVVVPRPDEIDYIHETYSQIVRDGQGNSDQREGLTRLAHLLRERDQVDAILLAGTDLALIFNEANTSFPHIDCARLHIQAIMSRLFVEAAASEAGNQ